MVSLGVGLRLMAHASFSKADLCYIELAGEDFSALALLVLALTPCAGTGGILLVLQKVSELWVT